LDDRITLFTTARGKWSKLDVLYYGVSFRSKDRPPSRRPMFDRQLAKSVAGFMSRLTSFHCIPLSTPNNKQEK